MAANIESRTFIPFISRTFIVKSAIRVPASPVRYTPFLRNLIPSSVPVNALHGGKHRRAVPPLGIRNYEPQPGPRLVARGREVRLPLHLHPSRNSSTLVALTFHFCNAGLHSLLLIMLLIMLLSILHAIAVVAALVGLSYITWMYILYGIWLSCLHIAGRAGLYCSSQAMLYILGPARFNTCCFPLGPCCSESCRYASPVMSGCCVYINCFLGCTTVYDT